MSDGVKWIKLSTGIFDNRKVKAIEELPEGDAIINIWLKLLVLAGNVNDGGLVYLTKDIPYTDELLANEFRKPIMTVRLALDTFSRFGMIEVVNDIILISNWEKYQNVDGMDRIREQTRKRVASYRANQKMLESGNVTSNVTGNVTVTDGNATDIDKEIEKENIIKEKPNTTDNSSWTDRGRDVDGSSTQVRLGKVSIDKVNICGAEAPQTEKPKRTIIPPKLEWIQEYCRERGNGVDPEKFFDFYESKGWMVGKNKMKDWQSSVRTWERNSPNQKKQDEDDDLRRFEFV